MDKGSGPFTGIFPDPDPVFSRIRIRIRVTQKRPDPTGSGSATLVIRGMYLREEKNYMKRRLGQRSVTPKIISFILTIFLRFRTKDLLCKKKTIKWGNFTET